MAHSALVRALYKTRAAQCFSLVEARYSYAGKEKMLSLGTYPNVSFKDARLMRDKNKALSAQSIDPFLERQEKKRIKTTGFANSFETLAGQWSGSYIRLS